MGATIISCGYVNPEGWGLREGPSGSWVCVVGVWGKCCQY